METFRGRVHLPGATKETDVELEMDWLGKEISVHLSEAGGGITDWPGLMVQTIGVEEAVFRTKGIPPLFTHWWHLARSASDDLWGIILGLPDIKGDWKMCTLCLKKVK